MSQLSQPVINPPVSPADHVPRGRHAPHVSGAQLRGGDCDGDPGGRLTATGQVSDTTPACQPIGQSGLHLRSLQARRLQVK